MKRRLTYEMFIGNLSLGGDAPIRVQSMTNAKTEDVSTAIAQIRKLYEAKCEIVRLAVPNFDAVRALPIIQQQLKKDKIEIPIVADVHFSPSIAIACVPYADKIRINPGNFRDNWDSFVTLIRNAKTEGKALRIGVNDGSLSKGILSQFGHTPEGMYQSLLPFLEIAQSEKFFRVVLSFKSSSVASMVDYNREIVKKLDSRGYHFPIHLGVTEAGNGSIARIKGAIGIGSLLLDGIGDTLRVSLTENPVEEIPVAYDILQACGRRITQAEYVACPSCGRTQFDIQKVLHEIKTKTSHLSGIKIAVMGCVVNGLGEVAEADFGYVGAAPGKINLYQRGHCIKTNIPEALAIQELLEIIDKDE